MKKIILINCYFGKFPSFFNLFLKSCEANPSVDFLIFSDCKCEHHVSNIIFKYISFEELRDKIKKKFDFPITLETPYKLCDYKPAYGYIFEDEIRGYDFWGNCDIDMLFGDIRSFLTDNLLNKYDKFYQLGHLTLYRNTPSINRIFMNNGYPCYKDVFTTNKIMVFDETLGIQKKFEEKNIKCYLNRDYADISHIYYRFRLSNQYINIDPKNNNYKYQVFEYNCGHVYRYFIIDKKINRDEFIYIHIQKRIMKQENNMSDRFFITYDGFKNNIYNNITARDIKALNAYKFTKQLSITCKRSLNRLKKLFNKLKRE